MGWYEAAKTAILAKSNISDAQRLHKSMQGLALGNGKPSALLRKMQQMVSRDDVSQELFTEMWMQHLSDMLQAIYASSQSDNIDDLTSIVDAGV